MDIAGRVVENSRGVEGLWIIVLPQTAEKFVRFGSIWGSVKVEQLTNLFTLSPDELCFQPFSLIN